MASFQIHLMIGKKYLQKNSSILKKEEFYQGVIAPDLEKDKSKSHYSGPLDKNNLCEYLKNKVNLKDYLKENQIDTDYQKGVFLHLITDFLFYNEFFEKSYLRSVTYEKFVKDMYYSYDLMNDWIGQEWKVGLPVNMIRQINEDIEKSKNEKNSIGYIGQNILPIEKLEKWMEDVSSICLEEYKQILEKEND